MNRRMISLLVHMSRILCIFLAFFTFALPGEGADRLRISVTNFNMSFLPAGIALKKGFFRDEGFEAEVIRMNANVAVAALASGDIDSTLIFGSVVRAAIRGLPMKVVASLIDSPTHALIARPDFKTVKDLRGKTLGIQAHGATDHVVALMIIRHFGIDPEKEIKVVALGPASARFAALKEGVVDVAVISPPGDADGKKLGFNVIARAHELFKFPFVGLGANVRKIQERPDEVKRVIKAMVKANRFIRENREESVRVLIEWGRVEREQAYASYDSIAKAFNWDGSIPEDGLRTVIEQAKKELKVGREISLSEVSDLTALREAQRELGIKGR